MFDHASWPKGLAIYRRSASLAGQDCSGQPPTSKIKFFFSDRVSIERCLRGHLFFFRIAQHVAAAPDRLDVMLSRIGHRQLLPKLADKNVDDFEFGLVDAA